MSDLKTRKKSKVAKSESLGLLAALKFVSLAQRKEGDIYQTHCVMRPGTLTAFDGLLACGQSIEESFEANPNTDILLKALSKCKDSIAITHTNNQLKIVSQGFKVSVPCDPSPLISVHPDMPTIGASPALRTALGIVADLPEESDDRLPCRSVLMQAGSVVGSRRGHVLMEAWHGLDLPGRHNLPMRAVKALIDCKKEIKSLGFGSGCVTFWMEDDSWIRTQLHEGTWPDYKRMLDVQYNCEEIPLSLFIGISEISSFSTDGRIRFGQASIQTHSSDDIGARIECSGLRPGPVFSIAYLKLAEDVITKADFYHDRGCFFIGEKDGVQVRGAIAKMLGE